MPQRWGSRSHALAILFAERLAAAETELFSISVSLPVGTNAIEGALSGRCYQRRAASSYLERRYAVTRAPRVGQSSALPLQPWGRSLRFYAAANSAAVLSLVGILWVGVVFVVFKASFRVVCLCCFWFFIPDAKR